MEYKTYAVSNALRQVVQCYWTLEGEKEAVAVRQTIVPDGCMEMIFHHGDLYRQYLNNEETVLQPRCFVFGQLSGPLNIEPTGNTGIFSIRFHPDGFAPFANVAIKEMKDKAVSLELIFGNDGKKLAADVLLATSISQKIERAEQFLLLRLTQAETVDRITKALIETILSSGGTMAIDKLADHSRLNTRKVERKLSKDVGLSPKQLSRIVRLQAIFKKMFINSPVSFTELAYDGQYYDQAHFTKEFKQLTGFTPKQFYTENMKMSALLYGSD